MAAATSLNLCGILSESKRIINAHSGHFLALSVIFLLPLSFSLMVSPFLIFPSHSSHTHILLRFSQPQQNPSSLLSLLLFSLSLLLFSLCALASITHSVFHDFFDRTVKLLFTPPPSSPSSPPPSSPTSSSSPSSSPSPSFSAMSPSPPPSSSSLPPSSSSPSSTFASLGPSPPSLSSLTPPGASNPSAAVHPS